MWSSGPRVAGRLAVLTVLQSLTTVGQIALAGRLVGQVQGLSDRQGSFGDVLPSIVAFALLFVLAGATGIWVNETRLVLSELTTSRAQREIADAATRAPLIEFDRSDFHDLLMRAISNASVRPLQVAQSLSNIGSALVLCVALVVTLAFIQPVVLIVLVLGSVPVWLLTRRVTRIGYDFAVEQTGYDRRRSYLMTLLTLRPNAAEMRAFALSDHVGGRFGALWQQRIDAVRDVSRRRGILGSVGRIVNGTVIGVVIAVLVWTVAEGRADLAAATTAAGAVALLGQRLTQLLAGIGTLYECALFLSDVEQFSDTYSLESTRRRTDEAAHPIEGRLIADGITFSYPASTAPVLDDVSIEVGTGEMIALVGANGSGKTTLSKILAGLLEQDSGSLSWNGREVLSGSDSWHDHVAIVFQEFTKYLLPLGDNVRFGRIGRDTDRIAHLEDSERPADPVAAIGAHGDAVLDSLGMVGLEHLATSLPAGLETTLGPEFAGGSDLSGGQWQRVAIARAFFRDAPVVILDEPSAALDPDSEEALFNQVKQLCEGRAVVVVSHRLATVTAADRIYVMSEGRVIEHGSHQELMALGGDYARMFRTQADRFSID